MNWGNLHLIWLVSICYEFDNGSLAWTQPDNIQILLIPVDHLYIYYISEIIVCMKMYWQLEVINSELSIVNYVVILNQKYF